MNSKVDFFFEKANSWQQEYLKLRSIIASSGLREELKWGVPCYTYHSKNVVLIHGFKEYCALLFHKGALIEDTHSILIQQTENVQSARQIRFTDIYQINELEDVLKQYIQHAIEIEKSGIKVQMKSTSEFTMPEELEAILHNDADLQSAFKALTPGRQRAYLLFFSQPKQAKNRETRILKSIPRILDGKGLND